MASPFLTLVRGTSRSLPVESDKTLQLALDTLFVRLLEGPPLTDVFYCNLPARKLLK